jgi:hypothetical protein
MQNAVSEWIRGLRQVEMYSFTTMPGSPDSIINIKNTIYAEKYRE